MMTGRLFCARVLTTWLCCLSTAVAAVNTAKLPRTSDSITIDGVLDEIAWQQATRIDLDFEIEPGENIPARVKTIAYVVEDGTNLYIAFDSRDPQPDQIRAYLRDRDSAWNDDYVGIGLDTYNDELRAFEFYANPLGVQMDATYDDVNSRYDDSWDAIWDAAGAISEHGYIVEIEIPLNQLRFPQTDGMQTWGISLSRYYPRDRSYRFGYTIDDRSRNCYLCDFGKISGLEDADPGRNLEIVPTLTSTQTDSTDDPGVTPLQSGDTDTEAGVSIRWGITQDMTVNLALNPDFSQVEADVAQLDVNNQFALFYPEKRPFFLEGADYFSTPIEAVFTRTVADPDAGVKLTGKRGNHTYGVFAAQDAITNLVFPGAFGSDATSLEESNDAFVGRYNWGFSDASTVGALLTSRSGEDYKNTVGGFDLRWKMNDQNNFRAQYLKSDTEYPEQLAIDFGQPLGSFSGEGVYAGYEYESRNWFAAMEHLHLDAGFRADAGFAPQVDIEVQKASGGYKWHGTPDDWWSSMQVRTGWEMAHDDSGQVIDRKLEAGFAITGPLQSVFEVVVDTGAVLWDDVLYDQEKMRVFAAFQPRSGLALRIFMRYGDQVDFANSRPGKELRLRQSFEWNMNQHLLLRLQTTLASLDTEQGEQIFNAAVYDLRLTWQFNRRSFLRLTTQYQDIDRNVSLYIDEVDAKTRNFGQELLFSYKINPQTVFFLGYSNQQFEDDELNSLEETDRTLFMKVGYAWTP